MNKIEKTIGEINNYLASKTWCDFSLIELRGNLLIGGKTSFGDFYDIKIIFEEVFYVQCPYEWKIDTKSESFLIPPVEEQFHINTAYEIEQGYHLVKILAEDLTGIIYISCRNVELQLL